MGQPRISEFVATHRSFIMAVASWIKRAPYPKNWEKTALGRKLIADGKKNFLAAGSLYRRAQQARLPGVQPAIQFKNGVKTKPKFETGVHPIAGEYLREVKRRVHEIMP